MVTIDPAHRLVEGVATDGETIWVSSVLDRQILACRSACRTVATLPDGLGPLGIAWDWSRDLLWVAADCPPMGGIPRCESGELLAFTRAGRIAGSLAPPGGFHPANVSVSLLAVFVSDSGNGLVYGLLPRRRGLRPINRAGDGRSARGAALSADGTAVLVADRYRGIGKIDLKGGATTWLRNGSGKLVTGVDGLVRCGERYFGVDNGRNPGHVLSFAVRGATIEAHPFPDRLSVPDATEIAFDGKRLLVVANSGWELVGKSTSRSISRAKILEIPLANGCKQ